MIKKLANSVSTAVKGDLVRDHGVVYEWTEEKESLHVLEYVKAGEHRLGFSMVPDGLESWRGIAPGFPLVGEREDMLARLGEALRVSPRVGDLRNPQKPGEKASPWGYSTAAFPRNAWSSYRKSTWKPSAFTGPRKKASRSC